MGLSDLIQKITPIWNDTEHLERQLKDYVEVSAKLLWQRQAIFLAATCLGAAYFRPDLAMFGYSLVILTEIFDLMMNRRVRAWDDHSAAKARFFLTWVIFNTLLSAGAISLFVIMTALQEEPGGHFTPLFFLFAAALFAAMNNHQLIPVLVLRMVIYGSTFVFIAVMDMWPSAPPLTSLIWLNFFTTVFVLYFIVDCSFIYLRLYRKGQKQLDDLRLEHERTVEAYAIKTKFLATVSHELRTPLTSIKASIDLVNDGALGSLPEKIASVMQIAGKNSKRLADLINDLLDVQKIEAGKMSYRAREISVPFLVKDSIEANQSVADQLGIRIKASFPEDDLIIEGDEGRLMQVMANLLSNALKFSKEHGKIDVTVERVHTKVRISVRDYGIGISASERDLVFGKFTQIDSSDQRRVGGTGLGMHITKQIVEQHGGRIDFTSTVGGGSTFFVEFEEQAGSRWGPEAERSAPKPMSLPNGPSRFRASPDVHEAIPHPLRA